MVQYLLHQFDCHDNRLDIVRLCDAYPFDPVVVHPVQVRFVAVLEPPSSSMRLGAVDGGGAILVVVISGEHVIRMRSESILRKNRVC